MLYIAGVTVGFVVFVIAALSDEGEGFSPALEPSPDPAPLSPVGGGALSYLKEDTMSKETLTDLNTHTLIGHTDTRGTAWHYRAELQGDQPNHYPDAIPVDDVATRLFGWDAEQRPVAVERPADVATMTHLDHDGHPVR